MQGVCEKVKTKTILEYAYYNDQVSPMGDLTIKRLNSLVKKGLLISKPNDKFWLSEDGLTLFLKNRGW